MRLSGMPVHLRRHHDVLVVMAHLLVALLAPFASCGSSSSRAARSRSRTGGLLEILLADGRLLLRLDLLDRLLLLRSSVGRVIADAARAPASSMTSIALSGRNRPVR
jgi:hypothetical protein